MMREQRNYSNGRFWSGSLIVLLLAAIMLAVPTASSAGVALGVSVSVAPPAIPVYVQPPVPGPGYIWTPGYWAWNADTGYYWVPGTWVLAPAVGLLWTPGYWAWNDGAFLWHVGYWGPVVGFYGGINYGFGYFGIGYAGGYWNRGEFFYNRAVNNVSVTNIRNVYNKTVVNNVTASRASFNGGPGGTTARPTAAELRAAQERHAPPTAAQMRQERIARADPGQRAAVNHGRPTVAATEKPGVFTGHGVVHASRAGAPYKQSMSTGRSARASKPGGAEKHPLATAPKHTAPQRPTVRHEQPRGGSHQAARHPSASTPRVAGPQRPATRHEQPMGGISHQEGRHPSAGAPKVVGPERPAARHEQPMGGISHQEGRYPSAGAPKVVGPERPVARHEQPMGKNRERG